MRISEIIRRSAAQNFFAKHERKIFSVIPQQLYMLEQRRCHRLVYSDRSLHSHRPKIPWSFLYLSVGYTALCIYCDKYRMLTVLTTTGEYDCTVTIQGPVGVILIHDLVWCPPDRQDLLEIYYWESYAVLQGGYHCCFSIPGKVQLLPA